MKTKNTNLLFLHALLTVDLLEKRLKNKGRLMKVHENKMNVKRSRKEKYVLAKWELKLLNSAREALQEEFSNIL